MAQPKDALDSSIQYLKGVGPARAEKLGRLGVRTVADLLHYIPRDYQDMTDVRPINQLEEKRLQTTSGTIVDIDIRPTRNRSIGDILIEDATGRLRAVWFNHATTVKKYLIGDRITLSGKPSWNLGCWEMHHPHIHQASAEQLEHTLMPIYPLTEDLKQSELQRVVKAAVESFAAQADDPLPESIRTKRELLGLGEAIASIHFPKDGDTAATARRRLAYEELLILQLAVILGRPTEKSADAPVINVSDKIDQRIRRLFPFEFTSDQDRVVQEIAGDLQRSQPMNRLLQGDVGTGKTAVALYALLAAVANKFQTAFMVPTEVLAQQHWATLSRYLVHARLRMAFLAGGLAAKQRNKILDGVRGGEVDLVVGTQAIIQEDVQFQRLGLVVIDEQHKFGVRQRARFRDKGLAPHYLVMTATPIPRTLTMTVFDDLDVSTLKQRPPGRVAVRTYLVEPAEQKKCWEFVARGLSEGRQAFVICPLVEQSEKLHVAAATDVFDKLRRGLLSNYRVGILHGRMEDEQKAEVMERFRNRETAVLVSTQVVEVGVDVPNATLMVVLEAQRFGLSQLHQLRGRVSRGEYPGNCFLFAKGENELAKQRLDILVKSDDGFEIAEADLKLRGPGEFLGTRQHGVTELRVADITKDVDLLMQARDDASEILRQDPKLAEPDHQGLLRLLIQRHGDRLNLSGA